MTNQLKLKDAKKIQRLVADQFKEIGKIEMLSEEETWSMFLKQAETKEIDPKNLPMVKGILFGNSTLAIKDYTELLVKVIKKRKYCPILTILDSMTKGNLLPELVHQYEKFRAEILS
tara:strand:- start:2084 stop:2434 length:351 start_codon:yes stop_codon:yes gene_type:complete